MSPRKPKIPTMGKDMQQSLTIDDISQEIKQEIIGQNDFSDPSLVMHQPQPSTSAWTSNQGLSNTNTSFMKNTMRNQKMMNPTMMNQQMMNNSFMDNGYVNNSDRTRNGVFNIAWQDVNNSLIQGPSPQMTFPSHSGPGNPNFGGVIGFPQAQSNTQHFRWNLPAAY